MGRKFLRVEFMSGQGGKFLGPVKSFQYGKYPGRKRPRGKCLDGNYNRSTFTIFSFQNMHSKHIQNENNYIF